MIKALVSIDPDLPSSIALRYACQLGEVTEIEIQTIHIHEPHAAGIGAGWARRTWEKELQESGKKEISQLLTAEKGFCPVLRDPIIFTGDRETGIIAELEKGNYNLFVEGAPTDLTAKALAKRLNGHFYQHLTKPVLFARNLFPLERVFLVIEDGDDYARPFAALAQLFEKVKLEFDVFFLSERGEESTGKEEAEAAKEVESRGWKIRKTHRFTEGSGDAMPNVDECGLIAVYAERPFKGKSQLTEFLARSSCPILFLWG